MRGETRPPGQRQLKFHVSPRRCFRTYAVTLQKHSVISPPPDLLLLVPISTSGHSCLTRLANASRCGPTGPCSPTTKGTLGLVVIAKSVPSFSIVNLPGIFKKPSLSPSERALDGIFTPLASRSLSSKQYDLACPESPPPHVRQPAWSGTRQGRSSSPRSGAAATGSPARWSGYKARLGKPRRPVRAAAVRSRHRAGHRHGSFRGRAQRSHAPCPPGQCHSVRRHRGAAPPLTGDFWNVRHICANSISAAGTSAAVPAAGACAAAGSAGRASIAAACRSARH